MRLLTLVTLLCLFPLAHAADVPVRYTVDAKALKAAVSGTSLTFSLFTDPACSSSLFTTNVNIENVKIVSAAQALQGLGCSYSSQDC